MLNLNCLNISFLCFLLFVLLFSLPTNALLGINTKMKGGGGGGIYGYGGGRGGGGGGRGGRGTHWRSDRLSIQVVMARRSQAGQFYP